MTVYGIHVGCNEFDEKQYPPRVGGWSLPGSIVSAQMVAKIVRKLHPSYVEKMMSNSTVAEVRDALFSVAKRARADDLVIFSYSGHGAQVPTNFNATAPNRGAISKSESDLHFEVTILLRDRMMLANEYRTYLRDFAPGVRFLSISDGCGLGTFNIFGLAKPANLSSAVAADPSKREIGAKTIPIETGSDEEFYKSLYDFHKDLYKPFLADPGRAHVRGIGLGAAMDGEHAYQEGDGTGSFFARALTESMSAKRPPMSYNDLRSDVENRLRARTDQDELHTTAMHPPLVAFGAANIADFKSKPFE